MKKYPKIETLYVRDPKTFQVNTTKVRCPEFEAVKKWAVTEKIDGTNIRIHMDPYGHVTFGGRTDRAQIPADLVNYLNDTFTEEKMKTQFPEEEIGGRWPEVTLYGEGYGPKIQKHGAAYRDDVAVRLFDVFVGGLWLELSSVEDVACGLGVKVAPYLVTIDYFPSGEGEIDCLTGTWSDTATDDGGATIQPEGIVARSSPLLLNRRGDRVMWKLKYSDFRKGKK